MFKPACKILVAAAVAVSLAACGKKSRNSGGGGVDGGGGDPVLATREEVVKAVNEAWTQLTKVAPENPLVSASMALDEVLNSVESAVKPLDKNDPKVQHAEKVNAILEKILSQPAPGAIHNYDFPELPNIEQLGKKRPQLLEKGLCSGSGHKATTASVSKLSMDAEICVSIEGLQRLATASLQNDILALLVHEIAHLFGYGEEDAEFLQNHFLKNMEKILRKDGAGSRANYREIVDRILPFSLLRYDVLDGKFMADVRVQQEVVSILFNGLSGATEDDIKLAQPENERKARQAVCEAMDILSEFIKKWEASNKDWRPIPVTAEHLKTLREIGLVLINTRQVFTEFVGYGRYDFPDVIKAGWPKQRDDMIKFTDPKTLTNPSLRYKPPEPEGFFGIFPNAQADR